MSPTENLAAPARPSVRLVAGLTLATVVLAVAGYAWKGAGLAVLSGNAPSNMAASAAGQAPSLEQIEGMVGQLALRLKEQPDDLKGWTMLARTYSMLERFPEAAQAYKEAMRLSPQDPDLLADYADVLAVQNGRSLEGEPIALLERALQIDPANTKALTLAGAHAFDQKNYAAAVRYWDALVQSPQADPTLVEQVQPALSQARQRAGLPAPAPGNAQGASASTSASVSGTVGLSAALAQQASPQDTVFIFARAAQGGRMPLAIVRKQVKDLPIAFSLDDSMAMSPAATLSGAGTVVIGARISKSGNAMPQPGDLQGLSAPVQVGAKNVRIDITEVIKP